METTANSQLKEVMEKMEKMIQKGFQAVVGTFSQQHLILEPF